MDDYFEKPITVTVLDTVTGQTRVDSESSQAWYESGNGSCDCNREILFNDDWECTGTCLGCKRYLIIATDTGTLQELNSDYPVELLNKYLGSR